MLIYHVCRICVDGSLPTMQPCDYSGDETFSDQAEI